MLRAQVRGTITTDSVLRLSTFPPLSSTARRGQSRPAQRGGPLWRPASDVAERRAWKR
jgi:hypothetical protein